MEKGLMNLNQAYRAAQKKQNVYDDHTDSGIGMTDHDDEAYNNNNNNIYGLSGVPETPIKYENASYLQTRVPSIESMLSYPSHFLRRPPRLEKNSSLNLGHSSPTWLSGIPEAGPLYESGGITAQSARTISDPPASKDNDSTFSDKDQSKTLEQDKPDSQSIVKEPGVQDGTSPVSPKTPSNSLPSDSDTIQSGGSSIDSFSETTRSVSVDGPYEIRAQKEQIIDRLMLRFYEIFNTAGFSGAKDQGSSSAPNVSTSHSNTPPQRSSNVGSKKRTSDERGEDQEDENNNANSRKRSKNSDGAAVLEEEKKKLACPYFKHNPRKYQGLRSCPGPGWDTVHRIK
jgi:hypothetical protein